MPRHPPTPIPLLLTLLAVLTPACGSAGPSATGWWRETGFPDPSRAMHLAIGPATGGTLEWRGDNLRLDHVGLVVTSPCTGWSGTDASVHFAGDAAAAFGAPAGSDGSVTAKVTGTQLTLTWVPRTAVRKTITDGYRTMNPGTSLPQSTVLDARVGLSGTLTADGKTLHLDFDAEYTDPDTGKAVTSDKASGITFTREASCGMTG